MGEGCNVRTRTHPGMYVVGGFIMDGYGVIILYNCMYLDNKCYISRKKNCGMICSNNFCCKYIIFLLLKKLTRRIPVDTLGCSNVKLWEIMVKLLVKKRVHSRPPERQDDLR